MKITHVRVLWVWARRAASFFPYVCFGCVCVAISLGTCLEHEQSSLLIFILRLNLVLPYGIPPGFRGGGVGRLYRFDARGDILLSKQLQFRRR